MELTGVEPERLRDLAKAAHAIAEAMKRARWCIIFGTGDLKAELVKVRACAKAFDRANTRLVDTTILPTMANLKCLLAMDRDLGRYEGACMAVRKWLEDIQPESNDALADYLLGVFWRMDRDPVMLVGKDAGPVVAKLRERGLKRISVLDLAGTPIPETLVIKSPYECRSAVTYHGWPTPEKVIYRVLDDSVPQADLQIAKDMIVEAVDAVRVCNNTIDLFGEIWALQGMANLAEVASNPTLRMYEKAFEGKPAVIVATGPSLSKNIHLLHDLKGRALIITFSHTLKAVLAAGVDPDVVLALDPEDLRYHFHGCDTMRPEAYVLGATVHPGVFELPRKRVITFCANNHVDSWIDPLASNVLSTGGSVACSALALCHWFGCGPIMFMGQDLAYTGGQVYAKGTVDDTAIIAVAGPAFVVKSWSKWYSEMATVKGATQSSLDLIIEVDGWDGAKVITSAAFNMYRKWLEAYVKQHNLTAWNCTEGGSKIHNMEQMTLREAIDRVMAMPAGHGLDSGSVFDSVPFDRNAKQQRMLDNIATMIDMSTRARDLASECLRMSTERKAEDGPRLYEESVKLQKLIDKIPYVVLACQRHLAQTMDPEIQTNDDIRAAAIENYGHVIRVTAELLPILERSAEKIRGLQFSGLLIRDFDEPDDLVMDGAA